MKRLVDAIALQDQILTDVSKSIMPNDWYEGVEYALDHIINSPTIKPERKKGEWIENSPVTEKCDQCGYVIRDWFVSQFNFCPNCGCQMGGDNNV